MNTDEENQGFIGVHRWLEFEFFTASHQGAIVRELATGAG
jgi:hypothetical protein